jgi:tight adherence protein B
VATLSPGLLSIMTFGAVVTAIGGAYSILSDLFLRDRSRMLQRVDEEFRNRQRQQVKKSLMLKDLRQILEEGDDFEETAPGLRQRFEAMVEQSGLELTPERLQVIVALAALGVGTLLGLLRQSAVVGILGGLAGAAVPILYVQYKRNARSDKLRSQLPDAFDLMGRVIRAGQTMSQALQAVADEFPLPIAGEFAYCYEQQNLGLPAENAFRDLSRRNGLIEIKIFVMALLVQQQTGGNLAELLDKLAAVIRDRDRIRGQIRALTAEGRLQGAVLLALPPAMFFIMMLLNRQYTSVLLEHPSLIVTTLTSELIGALCIRRIVNFDF